MTMALRTVVARSVKTAVASATRSVSAPLARRSLAAVSQLQQQNQHVRMSSSSRFLSLADDDDGEKKRRRRGEDGEDGDDEDGEEGLEAAGEGADGEEAAEKDGDLELEELEMYKFCVTETEELDTEIMELYMSNPLKWTPERLARKFHLSKQRIEATIFFEAEDAGLTVEEMKSKIEDAKTLAAQDKQDESVKLKSAEARGDEQEIKRLQKRERQDQRDTDEIDDEELTREEEAMVLGIDDDHFRNPDFFFLSDHFDGLPPLVRRLGKHKATDKLYPEEALEIQRLAAKNKIVEHKSFAKPSDKAMRWKIAVKDTSKIKMPLLVRDGDRALRLATKEEVLPRTWVRRPAFFAGLNPSDN